MTPAPPDPLTVVGVGADGWAGLAEPARAALTGADVVFGSARQLDLLPAGLTATRVPWPSPLLPALPALLAAHAGAKSCVLASGDPMFHGIGATLARLVGAGPGRLHVLPHPSSASLAAARLGWPLATTAVHSLVSAPPATLIPDLHPGRRLLVLGAPVPDVLALLVARGLGDSTVGLLSQLGGPGERITTGSAAGLAGSAGGAAGSPGAAAGSARAVAESRGTAAGLAGGDVDPLTVMAIDCAGAASAPVVPGLPDDLYESDGQLTKREVRAVTLAVLGPRPGELLWDVGAGSGSIGIEWMRSHPSCRAIAVESVPDRVARISANAAALGVPGLRVITGRAPSALAGLPAPAAIFIGGGLTGDGVLAACWAALPTGGRLVANAVTLESEAALAAAHSRHGGELIRVAVQRSGAVGGFTGWRPQMPVTIWSAAHP